MSERTESFSLDCVISSANSLEIFSGRSKGYKMWYEENKIGKNFSGYVEIA